MIEPVKGKRYTWDEIVRNWPDRWVAMKNWDATGPRVHSAEVIAVLNDDEISDYEVENFDKHYYCKRTVECGIVSGYVTAIGRDFYLE